ncbi:MAG: hypothetical protein IPJ65_19310 [Archangiaceae bacterium]|nr:hypothetical protein [Archangiaceae bacterium]
MTPPLGTFRPIAPPAPLSPDAPVAPAAPTKGKAPVQNEWADYFGDAFDKQVPKDGYLRFQVMADENGNRYPDRLRLADGRVAQVKPGIDADHLMITVGREKIAAVRDHGAWSFHLKLPKGTARDGDVIDGTGQGWRPLDANGDLPRVFREAYAVAKDLKDPRVDPATVKKANDAALDKKAPVTMREADQLAAAHDAAASDAAKAANALSERLSKLEELKSHGDVKISQDPKTGELKLELRRPQGTSDAEWSKLQRKFGARLDIFAMDLEKLRQKAVDAAGVRDAAAGHLIEKLESPEMKKAFSELPQPKRLERFNQLAAGLVGTSVGDEMGQKLFGLSNSKWPAVAGSNGVLKPDPYSVASVVLQGAYDSPEAKGQLKSLTLAMAPHLPDRFGMKIPEMVSERMFEITLGRPLTREESKEVGKLSRAQTPEEFEHVVHPEGHSGKLGLGGELLAKLGEAPEHSYLAGKLPEGGREFWEKASPKLRAGAALFSTFAAGQAWSNLMKHGLNPETAAEAAEGTTRAVGVWAEIGHSMGMGGEWMTKVAKGSSIAASAFGLMLDVGKAYSAESPDRREHYVGQALLSGVILGATLLDAPMVAVGAIAWKLLGDDPPSESYDKAYGRLERGVPEVN